MAQQAEMTAAKLKELEAKAGKDKWRVLCDLDGEPRGIQFGLDGGVFMHSAMPNSAGKVELIAYLRNHCSDFIRLMEAAEKQLSNCACRGQGVILTSSPDYQCASCGQCVDLREALAAFKEKS
jgi:hypothetical protein